MRVSVTTSVFIGLMASVAFGAPAAAAEKTKFEFWYGLSGDLGERVQDACKKFNDSQSEFKIVCTSQNGYDTTLQNTRVMMRLVSLAGITFPCFVNDRCGRPMMIRSSATKGCS